ncbi:MAG: aldo/keto reductase [Candidatus Omnitrophota bacterium]
MEYKIISNTDLKVSVITLGTWAFGGDVWWGAQQDKDSMEALDAAIEKGITTIDTAPVYGRGRSERVIGVFIKKRKLREKVVLATKLGLSWEGPKILHNLSKKRMLDELDESRQRLQTDYFDIYQVHWPDPNTSIGETAEVMCSLYEKGIIKAVGVSNYSAARMKEFMKYSPLHSLQPPYNMFKRSIEKDIVPFCLENNISILSYIPLQSGILTGKFFFDDVEVPDDLCRRNHKDLKQPYFSVNKQALTKIKEIADKYKKTLTQLVLNWTYSQQGITSIITGARNLKQLEENIDAVGWKINSEDNMEIESILREREHNIRVCT